MDFGFGTSTNGQQTNLVNEKTNETTVTDLTSGKIVDSITEAPIENITEKEKVEEGKTKVENETSVEVNLEEQKQTTLETGTTIEFGGNNYTVDEQGNVVDKDGNIFKKKEEVSDWLNGLEVEDNKEQDVLSIDSIQKLIGYDVTDENNNPIQFENTNEGVKAYIDAVVESKRNEHYETAINTLYQKYPILNDFLNYYIANGNSYEGFGQMPDRSNITIDDNNVEQQKEIIRVAWKEQNRKGDVEAYINYLDASGILCATAKEELQGLQENDKNARKALEVEAEKREKQKMEDLQKYWNGVNDVIKTRNIAGYQIPENIIINRNGQKISVTPNDFFNYLYRVDNEGYSAYERDLQKQTFESKRDDEILRAYLTFVGGNYSNLVDMAINQKQVAQLKLKAKEKKSNATIRINRPTISKDSTNFGY